MSKFATPPDWSDATQKKTELAEPSSLSTTRQVGQISKTAKTGVQQGCTSSAKRDDIVIVGFIWKSQQNGMVYSPFGISGTMTIGQHSGTEPKVLIINETS